MTMWDPYSGRKVVCIQDEWYTLNGEQVPVAGKVYTIREIGSTNGGIYIRLMEIVNAPRQYANGFAECAFDLDGFRPVDERKTDISEFEKLLKPAGLQKGEDADGDCLEPDHERCPERVRGCGVGGSRTPY